MGSFGPELAIVCLGGLCGALVGGRMRLPAGVLLGTAVVVALARFALGFPQPPSIPGGNSLLQLAIGVFVGSRITRSALSSGSRALLPASLLAALLLSAAVLSSIFVSQITPIELSTALFAAAPGGLTEMAAVGASFGADGAVIASIHLVRLLLAILAVTAISATVRRTHRLGTESTTTESATVTGRRSAVVYSERASRKAAFLPGLAGGLCGGLLGIASTLPAGALVGALLGSAAVALWRDLSFSTSSLKIAVQAFGGVAIGFRIQPDFFISIVDWAAAGAVILAVQMLTWGLAFLGLRKLFAYESITALFSSAPGGMGDLVSAAPDAGADLTVVAFSHLVRLTAIIVIVPYLFLALS